MDDNKLRFGVGVLVVAAICVAVILTFLFGAFPMMLSREYTLNVRFPSAEGVGTNTPVFRDGVRVGRVSDIRLLPEGGVLVTLSMDQKQRLSREYMPRIGVDSFITGDAKLEFVKATPVRLDEVYRGDPEVSKSPYDDGEYLNFGEKAEDPFNVLFTLQTEMRDAMQSVRGAGQAVEQAGNRVDQLGGEIEKLVDGSDENVDEVANQARETLEEFQRAIQDVRRVINSPGVQSSTERIPELFEEAKTTLQLSQDSFRSLERAGSEFEQVGRTANQVAESAAEAVNNLERFTRPFGEGGEQIASQVLRTLENLDRTLVQVEAFGEAINESDGTLRRIVEDDDLYWKLCRTLGNIEQATARLQPILNDVRVFTDKIARDPRQLGVRGALTQRPSGLGLK